MNKEIHDSLVVCGHFGREFMFGKHLIKKGDTLYKHKTKANRYVILFEDKDGFLAMDMPDGFVSGFLSGTQR